MITSLDGYVADEAGAFGWAKPHEERHRFVNDVTAPVGHHGPDTDLADRHRHHGQARR